MNQPSSRLRVLIIDDELSGRTMIEYYIHEFLNNLVDQLVKVSSIDEAKETMLNFSPNLVFTDYELSGEDGLKIAPVLPKNCFLVVVTAHSQYAINAIRASVFDYILKPIDEVEFIKFRARLIQYLNIKIGGVPFHSNVSDSFVIKENGENILIPFEDIIFLEASGAYSKVVTLNRKYIATKTLKILKENKLENTEIAQNAWLALASVALINRNYLDAEVYAKKVCQ
jgi:two-component system LytT family response regulator